MQSKKEFYTRWLNNEFGNRLRCWYSLEEVDKDYVGLVGVRYQLPGSPFCRYDLKLSEVPTVLEEFIRKGANPKLFTIGEAAPDHLLTMNAEVCQSERGLELHYSRHQAQMRVSLAKAPEWAHGSSAAAIMKHFCDPTSYDEIQQLLSDYPDHVVEFSTYQKFLGNCPRRNTLIWEVRSY